jgi:RNA polymerase sigma-70 factor (sigma-E family)
VRAPAHGTTEDGAAPADPLRELFTGHFRGLVRLAALLGADDPEDVAQEAFVRLHRSSGRLRDPGAALPYLRTTVVNLSRSRLRHLRVARRGVPPSPDVASAEHSAVLREDHREVVAALCELPARQREVLVLRYWLDLSEAEIADAMGISRGAVKSHASRAVAALERALEALA